MNQLKLEDEIQGEIQIDSPKIGSALMRNNSGAFTDTSGRTVRYGLGNVSKRVNDKSKSSDLIGPTTILITPSMVGKKVAIFTAIEAKKEGWKSTKNLDKRETAQKAFIDWTNERGGIAGFAASVDEFRKIVADYIAKLKS